MKNAQLDLNDYDCFKWRLFFAKNVRMNEGDEKIVRQPGLEPGSSRWQRPIVPLDHWRGTDGLHIL